MTADDSVPEHAEAVEEEKTSPSSRTESRSGSVPISDSAAEPTLDVSEAVPDDQGPDEPVEELTEDIAEKIVDQTVHEEEHQPDNTQQDEIEPEHEAEHESDVEAQIEEAEAEAEGEPEAEAEVEMAVASDGEQSSRADGQTRRIRCACSNTDGSSGKRKASEAPSEPPRDRKRAREDSEPADEDEPGNHHHCSTPHACH